MAVTNQAPDEDPMDGLMALARALRCPETIFGTPSSRQAVMNAKPLDWDRVVEQLAQCLEEWQGRSSDLHFQLHLGAAVLRKHGFKICSGTPRILFLNEEGVLEVFIELSVDATTEQVSRLNLELDDEVIDADVPDAGYCFCFCCGRSAESSVDVAGDVPMVA